MGQEERDWFRLDRKRRDALVWDELRPEHELVLLKRRLIVPAWVRESFRFLGYFAATLVFAWIFLFLVVPLLTR